MTADATLAHGDLKVTLRDNSRSPGVLSGIGSLINTEATPDFDAYDQDAPGASGGMNFEHIISGHTSEHNAFSPRHGRYEMRVLPDGRCAAWHRRAEDDPWAVESTTKLTLTAPHYLDFDFDCIPRDAALFAPQGYAIMFWCNYMNDVSDPAIHFRGVPAAGAEEQWIRADAPPGHPDWNQGGTYAHVNSAHLHCDADHNFRLNSWSYDRPRYTLPFYYGLSSHGMVLMLMFDRSWSPVDEIRFSLFKFKLKHHPRPAWDYQYVLHRVEENTRHGYRARAVWKRFVSPDDCLEEYRRWSIGRREEIPRG